MQPTRCGFGREPSTSTWAGVGEKSLKESPCWLSAETRPREKRRPAGVLIALLCTWAELLPFVIERFGTMSSLDVDYGHLPQDKNTPRLAEKATSVVHLISHVYLVDLDC